ncbi:MAG TPA: hypothetical protein VNM40_03025 [Candidatus Paceibacterota bacterium]|nr:hypothetical protein [Candidatus Paceibacterota bacterium]
MIMQAGTNNAVQISSLPVSMTFANGVAASHLSDCRVRNVTSLANSLNTSVPTIASGTNTFSLASPLTIGSSSTVTLAVTCDIAANAPLGGTIGLSLTPSSIPATVSGSGVSVTPIVGQAVGGGTGPTSGTVTISNVTAPTVPGVPNTGSGNALSVAVLALSAVLVFGAFAILMRRKVI